MRTVESVTPEDLLKEGEDTASENLFFSYPFEAILANEKGVSAAEELLGLPGPEEAPSSNEGVCHELDRRGEEVPKAPTIEEEGEAEGGPV